MVLFPRSRPGADVLRRRLELGPLLAAPGCYDALTARLLEAAGHEVAFVGGFGVAAARLGLPDVGLLSYGEVIDTVRSVVAATALPIIADADTGYGNAVNAQRTMVGYAQAGVACIMIEDQAWPKRCGHTAGKRVVDRAEAIARVQSCVDIREELGLDMLIMARTDAAAAESFDEALHRTEAFAEAGAEITFLEAPESEAQMARYCAAVPGWKTANMVEDGLTPWLTPDALGDLGYAIALYPVTLLLHGIDSMRRAAAELRTSGRTNADRASFDDARTIVGWPDYDERSSAYDRSEHTDTESI